MPDSTSECSIPEKRQPLLHLNTRFQTTLLLGAIILFSLLWRTWHLPNEVAWYDEIVSLRVLDSTNVADYWRKQSVSDPYSPVGPVYFTLEYFWSRFTSSSVLAVRTLSVIFGMLALAVVYMLAERLYGKEAGLVATLCFGLALPHVYFSQEIHMAVFSYLMTCYRIHHFAFLLGEFLTTLNIFLRWGGSHLS